MSRRSSAYNLENFEKAREARHEFSSLRCAVSKDRRDEFVRLIRSPVVERVDFLELNQIARNIITFNAVRCADAVLCGETDGIIDPHFGFDPNGQNALYEACYFFHPGMVKLLLKAGFSADDDRRAGSRPGVVRNLPLNVAVDALRSVLHLRSHEMSSAVKLLNRIFPQDAKLECIRLLALNTSVFNQIFFDYAKKGFLVEVGAMLLAAGDNLMPLCISDGEDDFVFNSFKELSQFLQANIVCVTKGQVYTEWKETLKLLDIYDKIGNQLTAYARLKEDRPRMEFATLLEDAAFELEISDCNLDSVNRSNISSFNPSVPQNMNLSNGINQKPQQPSMPTMHQYHTLSYQTMVSKHAPMTPPPMKLANATQSLDSRKFLGSFMRILPRVARRV